MGLMKCLELIKDFVRTEQIIIYCFKVAVVNLSSILFSKLTIIYQVLLKIYADSLNKSCFIDVMNSTSFSADA